MVARDLVYGLSLMLSVFTVAENLGIICLFIRHRDIRVARNYIICSLAVADLLIGVFAIPFAARQNHVDGWPFADSVCFAHVTIDMTATLVSILTVTLTALLDIRLVYGNLKTQIRKVYSSNRVFALVSISWILPICSIVVPLTLQPWLLKLFVETAYNTHVSTLSLNNPADPSDLRTGIDQGHGILSDVTAKSMNYDDMANRTNDFSKRCLPNFPRTMYITLVVLYYLFGMTVIACSYSAIYIRIKRRHNQFVRPQVTVIVDDSSVKDTSYRKGSPTALDLKVDRPGINEHFNPIQSNSFIDLNRIKTFSHLPLGESARTATQIASDIKQKLGGDTTGSKSGKLWKLAGLRHKTLKFAHPKSKNRIAPGSYGSSLKVTTSVITTSSEILGNKLEGPTPKIVCNSSFAGREDGNDEARKTNALIMSRKFSLSGAKSPVNNLLSPSDTNNVATLINSRNKRKSHRWAKNIRLLKMTFTLGVVASICYIPGCIVFLLDGLKTISLPLWAYNFAIWFSYAKSGINPIIYGFMNTKFRVHICNIGRRFIPPIWFISSAKRSTTGRKRSTRTSSTLSIISPN